MALPVWVDAFCRGHVVRRGDEGGELHREGLVEAEVGAQLRALLGRGVLPQQVGHRVADILEQHEGDEGHREHDHDGLEQAAQDEGQHAAMMPQRCCDLRRTQSAVPSRAISRTSPYSPLARLAVLSASVISATPSSAPGSSPKARR